MNVPKQNCKLIHSRHLKVLFLSIWSLLQIVGKELTLNGIGRNVRCRVIIEHVTWQLLTSKFDPRDVTIKIFVVVVDL